MEHFRSVRGLGIAASVLIGLVALGNVAEAAADWLTYTAVRDYRGGDLTGTALSIHDTVRILTDLPFAVLTLAAIAVFIVWLHSARINAERLVPAEEHRRGRVWVWLSWFVPVVNLWFPKAVVEDVWRASDPRLRGVPMRERPLHTTTTRWWTAYLLMWLLDFASFRTYDDGVLTTQSYLVAAVLTTMCAFVGLIAAFLAVQVVRQITEFQRTPLVAT
ncbi:DUF4328 domain-containing protein [Streptomyces sp. ID05-26A]|nr:DUF4328 domain-containing protein [Streptomyces sp. ID05-26A]